ncbi:MAG: DUF2243 domain-containing protein [Streptosporangiales bacterium]|nr:DUF2243 domain-containing protein [Streptosporangiales bacterium]
MASVRSAGLVLGLGVGGFIDGIALHQLVGWHHMLSGWYPLQTHLNMRADGVFHLACLVLVMAGIALLARAAPAPGRALTGWMLAGWGGFNLAEGLIVHQLLGMHHVRPGTSQLTYDLAYLASGVLLAGLGLLLARGVSARVPG